MTRFEKASVWITTLLVGITGIVYGWMKYLIPPSDPFSVVNHPLQPLFLKLHILVAPLFLLAIGTIAIRHIWRHFRSGGRRSRRTGITTALSVGPMVATGYLIQVITGETLLLAMVIAHVAFGSLYLAGVALHQWLISRSAPTRTRGGEEGRRSERTDASPLQPRRRASAAHRTTARTSTRRRAPRSPGTGPGGIAT